MKRARFRAPHLICTVNGEIQIRLLVQRRQRDAAACQVRSVDTSVTVGRCVLCRCVDVMGIVFMS